MIRRGRTVGWLQLPTEALLPWAMLNDVQFHHTVPGAAAGRGAGLLASETLSGDVEDHPHLLTVPRDLILSLERVHQCTKVDKDFREVLECLGEFGQTPRGAILTFLLVQASISCPDLAERVGVHSPFTDYIKSLPHELLPTFWAFSELQLLVGTTLAPAVSSKMASLQREYDLLCSSAERTRWYHIVQKYLDFDDWLQVDAMYRSRALDFPGIGHCMVPCLDLANHSSGEHTIAIYEKDEEGDAILLLRDGITVDEGKEVTITYGDEKGACEMLFSYGFLDESMQSAESLFLHLSIPDSDIFRSAKMKIAGCAPGFKLVDAGNGEVDWKGDFVWLLCVNEEDGFQFELARTIDSMEEETHAFFQDHELTGGAAELYDFLGKSQLRDVYRLRAVTILQQRVFDQMRILDSTEEEIAATPHGVGTDVRDKPYEQASRLRKLEFELMEQAYEDFEHQKIELSESVVVKRYLAEMNGEPAADDDDLS